MGTLPEDLTEPGIACCDLGIAAVISFHRSDTGAARGYLTAADPHARRLDACLIGPLALARSLDREHYGAPGEAQAALTDAFDGNEDVEEIEDLLADACVRLAAGTGDLSTAQAIAGHADTLAAGSTIPHRLANALYCRGLLDHDAARLLVAAERYGDAGRPLLRAKALEAACSRAFHRRLLDPGAGRLHHRRGGLHLAGRGRRRRPAAGRLPGPRHHRPSTTSYLRQSSGMTLHHVHHSGTIEPKNESLNCASTQNRTI